MQQPQPPWDRLPGALMPFDWEAFRRKHRILHRDHGGLRAIAGPIAFRLFFYAVGQSSWALDELLDPRWRRAEMRGPLFILGHQRSGTTLLHRLLSEDKTHGRSLLLHEMLLPADSAQRALRRIVSWDKGRGDAWADRLRRLEEKKFGPLDHIHRLRFGEVEEDEFVLWAIYASAMCVNDSPLTTADDKLDDLRHFDRWPRERQVRALGWYRACLLKKVHREPSPDPQSPPWIISKNPAFNQKIPALLRVFPDALLINLVRNPLQTIPSRLSLIQAIWQHRFPGFQTMSPPQVRTIVEDSLRIYNLAERDLAAVPAERRITIRYDALKENPRREVEKIYRRFRLPGPDASLAAALQEASLHTETHVSRHRYSLKDFGLDESELRERLAPVFAHYRF